MRFLPTDEQRAFAESVDALLAASDTVAVARAWAAGDHEPGLRLWRRLADQGVNSLLVPEEAGGMGATPVELVLAFEALGRYAVPGPWVESVAYLPLLVDGAGAMSTVGVPAWGSGEVVGALDADVAANVHALAVVQHQDRRVRALVPAAVGEPVASIDPVRRLFAITAQEVETPQIVGADDLSTAFDHAALAASAQLLGAGERLLADSVTYVTQRSQFGRPIGSYQAIKHALADVRIALDFARPLLWGAALSLTHTAPYAGRDVSAAKVACADAATLAARTALQVHGAIGYTRECDLSLWLLKVRASVNLWGTPDQHRDRVLDQWHEYDAPDVRWSAGG